MATPTVQSLVGNWFPTSLRSRCVRRRGIPSPSTGRKSTTCCPPPPLPSPLTTTPTSTHTHPTPHKPPASCPSSPRASTLASSSPTGPPPPSSAPRRGRTSSTYTVRRYSFPFCLLLLFFLSMGQSINQWVGFVCLSFCLSFFLSVCLSVCLFIVQRVSQSVSRWGGWFIFSFLSVCQSIDGVGCLFFPCLSDPAPSHITNTPTTNNSRRARPGMAGALDPPGRRPPLLLPTTSTSASASASGAGGHSPRAAGGGGVEFLGGRFGARVG